MASSGWSKLNGVPLAREGDPVDCPTCGGQGVIKCVMPRIHDRFNGREFALSDDLCICGCHPPPKLIADQEIKFQRVSTDATGAGEGLAAPVRERTASPGTGNASPAVGGGSSNKQTQLIRFVCSQTGKVLTHAPYRLELSGGKVIEGVTDPNSCSRPLTADELGALRRTT
jgi:uncharacterized Zn-binding protein involved in type VI secretion